MASTMVKYDDGVSFGAVAHCFPVRNLRRNIDNGKYIWIYVICLLICYITYECFYNYH